MSKIARKVATVGISVATVVSLSGAGALVPHAGAQTVADLQAQIAALQAQLAALSGGTTGACYSFTRSLTVGSQGADVTALQDYLTGTGHFTFSGGSTGYFGSITASAVASWQAANGVAPAVGYWGPISQAKYATMCGGTTSGGDSGSDDLSGGAGSVAEYKKDSAYNGEEVGEGQNDVTVLGLEIEASDDSDLRILAVKVDFDDADTANNEADLDKYLDDVSVWFDGDEVAREDADEFDDDNNYGRTLTLDSGVIVRAGERETLMVAVSGINNLDSSSAGDDWDVDIESVRWQDGQNSVVSEDPSITETEFTVENFATASDLEFKITNGDEEFNTAHIIDIDDSNATDNVKVFSFNVEVEGTSDLLVDDLTVEATVTGAGQLDEMADQAHLYVDGDKADSVTTPTDDETLTFDDLDLDLEAGETYLFEVALDFFATSGAIDEGDTIRFTIGETETNLGTAFTDIRDEEGNQLADADKTGTASSEASAVHDVSIDVELVGTPESELLADGEGGANDDAVKFSWVMDITAVGGTVYIANTSAPTTAADGATVTPGADGFQYRVYQDGTATIGMSDLLTCTTSSSKVTDSTNNFQIDDGGTTRCTMTVTHQNSFANQVGIWHADVATIGWSIADDDLHEYEYTYDLDGFETGAEYVN